MKLINILLHQSNSVNSVLTSSQKMMSWSAIAAAPAPKKVVPVKYVMSSAIGAFACGCGAMWGDIETYDPKEDGPYQEFFRASAAKKKVIFANTLVTLVQPPEKQEEKLRQFKEAVAEKEMRREQARLKMEEEARPKCLCGCGRPAHKNPRPDFIGHCCGWCMKHGGKKGHGDACGK